MKRLLLVLVVVGAMLFALPATAKKPPKPPKPPTDPPPVLSCSFDANGVLQSWHGREGDDRTCIWSVGDPDKTVRFHIESPDHTVTTVGLPHLIVNKGIENEEGIVLRSEKCFKPWQRGPQNLPFPAETDNSWEFSPMSAGCGESPYVLTISIKALKSGTVNLVMESPPSG